MKERRVTQATTGFDPALNFVGSSPTVGDRTSVGLVLPADPTPNQFRRYLCLLATVQIPANTRGFIRAIRQLLMVGWDQDAPANPGITVPVEFSAELLSPVYRFVDGNVSWHLTFRPSPFVFDNPASPGQPRSWSRSFNVSTPAIMYEDLPVSLGGPGYRPPNSGHPVGHGVTQLGQWTDLRYPWRSVPAPYPGLDACVDGPGSLMLWASVYQTNPETRPSPLPGEAPPPEFPWSILWDFIGKARFTRVAGELSVDLEKIGDDLVARTTDESGTLVSADVAITGGSHGR